MQMAGRLRVLKKEAHDIVVQLAKKHDVLHGKWLVRVTPDCVIAEWTRIRNVVLEG